MQAADGMSPPVDGNRPPLRHDAGMMALFLGKAADLRGERKGRGEIRKPEASANTLYPLYFDKLPFVDLLEMFLDPFRRERRLAAAAGDTGFVVQFTHKAKIQPPAEERKFDTRRRSATIAGTA